MEVNTEMADTYEAEKLTAQALEDVKKPTPKIVDATRAYVEWVLESDHLLLAEQSPEVLEREEEIKVLARTYEDEFKARHGTYPDITRWRKSPVPSA